MHMCRVAIWTINYANFLHADTDDNFGNEDLQQFVRAYSDISLFQKNIKKGYCQLRNFIDFINVFRFSIPTRCGYQFTRTSLGRVSKNHVRVLQAFPMLGLGVTLRIRNFHSHVFFKGLCSIAQQFRSFLVKGRYSSLSIHWLMCQLGAEVESQRPLNKMKRRK